MFANRCGDIVHIDLLFNGFNDWFGHRAVRVNPSFKQQQMVLGETTLHGGSRPVDFPHEFFPIDVTVIGFQGEHLAQQRMLPDEILAQIAERLWYHTSGHPFLVSALCKIIDEELKRHTIWRIDDVDEAVSRILLKQNTNFESLITNLENNPDLYSLVERLVQLDEQIEYNEDNHLLHLGLMYGILGRKQDMVAIQNRVYQERILNYLTINLKLQHMSAQALAPYTRQDQFLNPDASLNIKQVLLKFQEFMKQEYSQRDEPFLERNGRLVFFAFLRPILNGRGFAFKEPQISEEKRLDVVITFGTQKHVIELKIWRGEKAHQAGLRQLADYLERTGHDEGALVIFDFTKTGQKTWKQEQIQVDDKEIVAVWVR